MIGSFLRLITVLAAFAVVLSAAMLYRVKTETRELKSDIRALDRDGATIRDRIEALETEWAYLNSPVYLSELVRRHSDLINLVERHPDNFAHLVEIPPRGGLSFGDAE